MLPADGLAWDWVNRKLYWTDAEDNDIEVMDPVTTQRKVLISTGNATNPRAIVVDPQTKYVEVHLVNVHNMLLLLFQLILFFQQKFLF